MDGITKLSDEVSIGPQPDVEQLGQLHLEGFKSVINLRCSGEKDQPLSPEEEEKEAHRKSMGYKHIPLDPDNMKPERLDAFREAFAVLPRPIYIHCKSGTRAGFAVVADMAKERNMSADECLSLGASMGMHCNNENMRRFLKEYVDGKAS